MQNSTTPIYKRRNKLPKPRFQLRLAGAFMALVAMSLFVQTLVCGAQIARFARSFQGTDAELMEALPGLLTRSLIYGDCLVLPALGVMAIYITFRMAGPIYRFETHLREVIDGKSPGPCRIREGDYHKELCDLINSGLQAAAQQGPLKTESQEPREPPEESTKAA